MNQTLKEIAPDVARIALTYNPQTHTGQHFQSIDSVSQALAVKAIRLPFSNAAETERALVILRANRKAAFLCCQTTAPICIAT